MADERYLMFFGTLHVDNRLELIPGYLSNRRMPFVEGSTPPVMVDLLDQAGRILLRGALSTARYCGDGVESDDLLVRGAIPFRDDVRQIRFLGRDLELLTMPVSNASPELRLTSQPLGIARGQQIIAWEASHQDGLKLQYFLLYSTNAGRTWERLTSRLEDTEYPVDFDQVPGGQECRIVVVATDGVNTTTAETEAFSVAAKPCQVFLLEPADGEQFAAGRAILLRGQGYYLEEQRAETETLVWTSDREGELGRGPLVELRARLSPGEHQITLQAGNAGRVSSRTIRVLVEGSGSSRVP
jgi:hypothetical protein